MEAVLSNLRVVFAHHFDASVEAGKFSLHADYGVTSHRRTVLSQLAEANTLPSGAHATLVRSSVWPLRMRTVRPLATVHRRTVSSRLPEASILPSGDQATLDTSSVWP